MGEYRIRDEIELDVTHLFRQGNGSFFVESDSPFRYFTGNDCTLGNVFGEFYCHPRIEFQLGQVGDINLDGNVNLLDILAVISNWGSAASCALEDVNGDAKVDLLDILQIIDHWT